METYGRKPDNVKSIVGKRCTLPLREQLFEHEWDALCQLKEKHPKICSYYSDEFLCACLFARKMDLERVHVLLLANWKWRKENKMIKIPTIEEINLEVFHTFFGIPGVRTEDGCGILYATVNPDHVAGKEPWSVESVTKAATFFNFVGVFLEGMDYVRNGICIAMDLGNFGWNHWDVSFWSGMGGMWTDTFPMLMKRIAIVNPPYILSGLMKLASLFVKKKIMSRITTLDSHETVDLQNHLEISPELCSKHFGGALVYTWEQYEIELREYCKENQARLIALPPPKRKKGSNGEKSEDASYSQSIVSGDTSSIGEGKEKKEKRGLNTSNFLKTRKDKDSSKSESQQSTEDKVSKLKKDKLNESGGVKK